MSTPRRSRRDLFHGLAGGAPGDHAVGEGAPAVAELRTDVLRGATLVSAVVPLDEQRIDLGAGRVRPASGALRRTSGDVSTREKS